ncbi:MAG: DMT family transporter [Rhodospirillales bacterium]|nr:DMT family transporter [Rhodospirillales bacterium]
MGAWLMRFGAPPLFILLWSSGFVFLRIGLDYADPLTLLAARYALVLVVLVPLVLLLRLRLPRGAAWVHLAVVGVLLQAGHFACINLAVAHGLAPGATALITCLQPILVGLAAPVLAGERVSARRWLGLALGLAGAVAVIVARSAMGALPLVGLLFAVAGLFALAGATLYQRRFGSGMHPVVANLVQCSVGLAVSLPLAALLEPMRFELTPQLAGALAYLVLANSIVALSLLLAMVRLGEASRVSALFFLVPPTTALVAWAMLGDTLPPLGWAGMAASAAGVAIVTVERRRR